jgi:Zinc carboxypeptidase/Immune inhibitor A peptidase M6
MHKRRHACAAFAAVAAAALAVAVPASAAGRKTIEPLNQYVVSGKVNPEDLARKGFDLTEAQVKGKPGFAIVATPSQAADLAGKDVTVRPLGRGARTAAVAAPSPLTDPTHGYDVFRPWSLKPAPCPTTCATPLVPLKDFYDDLARRNPDVVKKYVYGKSLLGQDLVAYKVTRGAQSERTGSRPAVLYESTQHAREWIAAETERRLFELVLQNKNQTGGFGVKQLLRTKELWFVPIVNPDGYDYTFTSPATRLWRKNLRDNNDDGAITNVDGVDPNRNWPTKWNYDLEGASNDPTSETFHGSGPASEPEVKSLRGFIRNTIRPAFMIDYHSFAQLILYPEGWQVETPSTDTPLMASLAGDDDNPAVPGFDPDVSAELYTTNGDVTDDLYGAFNTLAYTVELDGGTGGAVGGTDGSDPNAYTPGGFVFQDKESDIAAEARKNFAFAIDLARSADDPANPSSHLGNTAPDLVPTTFPISYGDPQTVEVNAKRELGPVTLHWRVNGGRDHRAPTTEFRGGQRYGEPGVYYHVMRGDVTGTFPGDKVDVWFTARRGASSDPFTYEVKNDSNKKVLILGAEDYTGLSPNTGAEPGPKYLDYYKNALADAGIGYDVYDVDAQDRTAPSYLGVLSHYKAVVWYTGDDLYVRGPHQVRPGGSAAGGTTGTEKLFDDEIIASRDFMNEGGKLLVTGKTALQGAWDQFLYNPLGPTPPQPLCPQNQAIGQGALANDPPGQNFNCVAVSNDFQQYWLGAYLPITLDPATSMVETPLLGSTEFGLNGADSAGNQDNLYSLLTTSSILKPDTYPQFQSQPAIKVNGPAAFDPPTGSQYMYSQQADSAYKRLSRTVDLTGHTSGELKFKMSYDTENGFDYVFVEAHTVGQDDWTTLADKNGNTSQDTGLGCPDDNPFWLQENPFLTHYITRSGTTGAFECAPTGTSGSWNAATGNSAGFHDWDVDLSAFAGKQVEVSISYASDPATQGLGVFVDDTDVLVDGASVASTSFEDDLGGWSVPGAPADSGPNSNDWERTASVGFVDGPGIATDHSLYWGFGLEGVTDRATRATLMGDAMRYFGVQ